MPKKLVISLDALLDSVAGYVSVKGIEYPVRPITASGMQMVQRLNAGEEPPAEDVSAEARKHCPALPAEVWTDGAMAICGAIFGVAQQPLGEVEAALPNSSGPVTTNPAETNGSHGS